MWSILFRIRAACCIAAHQRFDRMGFAICIIAAKARRCSHLVRNDRFWIAGLRVFFSAVTEGSTRLALKALFEDACVAQLPVRHPALQPRAASHLYPPRKGLYLRVAKIL